MRVSLLYDAGFVNFIRQYKKATPTEVLIENILTPCREFKLQWHTDYLFFETREQYTNPNLIFLLTYMYTKHTSNSQIYFLKSNAVFLFKKEFEKLQL